MLEIRQSGPRRLLEVLTTKPVSILRAAPSTLRVLTQLPEAEAAFKGLRVVQTCGEPMTRADAAAVRGIAPANCFIRTTYGSTECNGLSWFVSAQDTRDPIHVPAGFLMPDTEAAIVDDFGRLCGPGEAGELLIRSRYNALGEWERGRVSPGRLTPDASHSGASIYRTGDIARLHSDGVFFVIGRKDRMLKINGQRFDPSEIEEALRKQPDVYRAEVVVDDRAEPARLLAIVVPSPEAHPDLVPRLNKALRAVLPNYMRPSRIVQTSAIPLLPGGKVDRTELLRIATSSVKPGLAG
jgi:acyl-coenzyme A synthetase/AMP-(fatty) acid ligase